MTKTDEKNLRLEYEKTQEMAIHYDTLNWTIGSILIAGVFVTIGIVGEKIQLYPHLAIFSFIVLGVWRLYYKRHKEIQRIKFRRLHEIEKRLKMAQHLRVNRYDKTGEMFGLKGDHCANILFMGIPAILLVLWFINQVGFN